MYGSSSTDLAAQHAADSAAGTASTNHSAPSTCNSNLKMAEIPVASRATNVGAQSVSRDGRLAVEGESSKSRFSSEPVQERLKVATAASDSLLEPPCRRESSAAEDVAIHTQREHARASSAGAGGALAWSRVRRQAGEEARRLELLPQVHDSPATVEKMDRPKSTTGGRALAWSRNRREAGDEAKLLDLLA